MERVKLTKRIARVTNLNLRAEGNDENNTIAVDISLNCQVKAEFLAQLSAEQKPDFNSMLFMPDGAVRAPEVTQYPFEGEAEGHQLVVHNGEAAEKFSDCKVRKFVAKPVQDGKVDLYFQVQTHPSGKQVAMLCKFLKNKMAISIVPPPKLPFEGKGEEDK